MSRNKIIPYIPKSFESDTKFLVGRDSDTYASIYMSMMLSPKWKSLSSNQKVLYLYCKAQYYGKRKKEAILTNEELLNNSKTEDIDTRKRFYLNREMWLNLYELYSDNGQFYKDMKVLIEKGFIKKVEGNSNTRKRNIYEFSDEWRNDPTNKLDYGERAKVIKFFDTPENESNRFIKITHYMLQHENFKKLSSSAKVALVYMLDWIWGNNEFLETGIFEFSTTVLSNNNIMSKVTAINALKELEKAKFIQKENNACAHSGITQKWSLTNRWYADIEKIIENHNYSVYLHIIPNGKKYVGISKDVQKRWGKNGEGYSANKDFYKDIQNFGWKNIEHIILKENLDKKEAMFYEYAYTAKYKSYDKSFGYNVLFLSSNEFSRRFCKKNEDKEILEKCIKEVEKE